MYVGMVNEMVSNYQSITGRNTNKNTEIPWDLLGNERTFAKVPTIKESES